MSFQPGDKVICNGEAQHIRKVVRVRPGLGNPPGGGSNVPGDLIDCEWVETDSVDKNKKNKHSASFDSHCVRPATEAELAAAGH